MKKNKSPYKRGNYAKLFAYWQSNCKGIATRQQLVEYGVSVGMTEAAAMASVTVMLSPREVDGRGDCRGNFSAHGEVYFAKPLNKVKGEDRKFALRWRETALEKLVRPTKVKAVAKKTVKAKVKKVVKAKKVAAVPSVEPTTTDTVPTTDVVAPVAPVEVPSTVG